jgi:spore cortex formation protein SpoVR/YcgB (stage V sporulation)
MEEFNEKVGRLVEEDTIESLSEARKLLLENCSRFGPEHKERLLDESARIHTLIMEKMEEQYDFSVQDIDLGDISSLKI